MINSFFFNYNSRIIQEYFQAKIGRKIRIFSLPSKAIKSIHEARHACDRSASEPAERPASTGVPSD